MSTVEVVTLIKDIILAVAAATTAFIAYRGVARWQEELKGKASFETARSLIRATYKLRDEIDYCRSPFIPASEFPENYSPLGDRDPKIEGDAYLHIYRNRWQPVSDAVQEFEASILEAEALWGSELKEKSEMLRTCVRDLKSAIQTVIEDKYSGGEEFKDIEFRKETMAKVSGRKSGDNLLSNNIAAAIEELELRVRPHLGRS
ncbi:hypothetical protein [Microbulbifer sp. HZ11]|uniref:hypothetical protein n=1 Tax=Microbulbifer sp. HZ11 TaxID=1453501 RepID=UPI0005B9D321|nr:hypothetical protein [Microbulbifer sp. HZ11]